MPKSNLKHTEEDILIGLETGQIGDGTVLAKNLQGEWFYNADIKKFMKYQGGIWVQRNSTDLIKISADILRRAYSEFLEKAKLQCELGELDEEKFKSLVTSIKKKLGSFNRVNNIKNIFEVARDNPAIAISEADSRRSIFDTHKGLLCFENGVFNFLTNELMPHDPKLLFTRKVGYNFNREAEAPTKWLEFIDRVTVGNKDLAKYLQKLLGFSMTGFTDRQANFLYGRGQNGKSVMLITFMKILGNEGDEQLTGEMDAMVFMNKFNSQSNADLSSLAKLKGVRLLYAKDLPEDQTFNSGAIKNFTGGEKITAKAMYKDVISFENTATLWMSGNVKPIIRDKSDSIWQRIKLIPFLATFDGKRDKEEIYAEFLAEAEGIIAWAVEGYYLYKQEGWLEPQIVRDATQEYRAESNPFVQLAETLEIGKEYNGEAIFYEYSGHKLDLDLPNCTKQKLLEEFKSLENVEKRSKNYGNVYVRIK